MNYDRDVKGYGGLASPAMYAIAPETPKAPLTLNRCMERLAGLVGRMSENNGMAEKLAEEIGGCEPQCDGRGEPVPTPSGIVSRFDDLLNDLQRRIETNAAHLGRAINRIG
jgi:hypothetical protein